MSWGCLSAIDAQGRTIWIADAHFGDGKRFVVRADEILTAFLELERAVCIHLLTQVWFFVTGLALLASIDLAGVRFFAPTYVPAVLVEDICYFG
jgi:hypothetical protein